MIRKKLLDNNNLPGKNALVKIVLSQHDEFLLECDENISEYWAKQLQECMEKAASIYCKYLTIPAIPNIAPYWSH
jgi:DNA polymerase I-like protein with 3'-5' exonuclease and polymerase domains